MTKKKYYITTTAPYVNAKPHIGFALEIIQADVQARYKRLKGFDVFFNFGTDEHGQKIYQKALDAGKSPKEYTDEYAKQFGYLKSSLNVSYDNFTRTTDKNHKKAAQKMWQLCKKNGFIEKGTYEARYCVGCELEKQDSDLENGKCPLHPTYELEIRKEENYFFKFSKFTEKIKDFYQKNPNFVVPSHRQKEIEKFVKAGLKDFSISRLKEKMPWGVAVPDDDKHVMYVWFDALTFYISALGWPKNKKKFKEFWGTKNSPNAVQFAGKDNLRQQSAMWQAMLMAAGLPTSKQVVIHGFITSGGQKMSKSIGNVVDPIEYAQKYGTDSLRYYLLAKISPFEDSDFTRASFEQAYQADLANGLGNLVARIAGLADSIEFGKDNKKRKFSRKIQKNLEKYDCNKALEEIWKKIKKADTLINKREVWSLKGKEKEKVLGSLVDEIRQIAYDLQPFIPETAKKITNQFSGKKIKKTDPLFPRLD